ncbi:MAG: HAMP domain-containing histidine kinase [Lachnospiraceae bacterium]|nr:HAMP domain-containing histidine kinase [Lachnospiraceae bacterium]
MKGVWECFLSTARSRAVTLCFLAIGGILIAGILAAAGTEGTLIAILEAACLVTVLLWLAVSGLLEWKRFAELEKLVEGLTIPERYLLGEMLPKPVNDMEKRYFQVMREVSRSAIGLVEQARREKEEYCDYVESWIHEMKTPLTACTLILDGAISRDNMQSCDSVPSCDTEGEKSTETEFMEGAFEEKPDIGAWLYERQTDLRKLRRELKRADNLTESILYYARLRTAEKDVKIREFSVGESVGEAVRSQMELLIGAGISVETEGDFTVHSDEKSLCFILKQLLINCAKYCPGCHIRIRAEEGVISVRDNGPGIPAHELHRVTERGFTGSRRKDAALGSGSTRAGSGGTGMGLYIVKELCDRLGITMEITSKEGEFTCVTLEYGSRVK